jgi:hypothetical protein
LASHLGGVGSFGLHLWQMSWADEIKLGTVTLTQVPVEDMPATQGAFIQANAPGAKAAWTIGMRALNRMGWKKTLGQFLVEQLAEKALLAAAEKSHGVPMPEQKAMACYYIGELRLSKGDKTGARDWFQRCRAAGMNNDDEYHFAGAELRRLEGRERPELKSFQPQIQFTDSSAGKSGSTRPNCH